MRGRALLDGRRRRSLLTLVLALCCSILGCTVLAGCGSASGSPPASSTSPTSEGLGQVTTTAKGVQEVTLQTQDDYVFTPDHFTVAPGTVRLTVTNVATQLTHNFRFTPDPAEGPPPIEAEIPLLAPGDSQTIEFTVEEPGDYPFECSFHTQLNQVGVMTVRG
jgi:plastocyanin